MHFEKIGGKFISPLSFFLEKIPTIKAYIFDWDGVFNEGFKHNNLGSSFSEPSSMGLNMLRFSGYLDKGKLPLLFIITGENNVSALKLAQREHFSGVYLNVSNKLKALEHIEKEFSITADQVAFSFDDILDLGMAKKVALRFFVRRPANPLLEHFVDINNLADYKTGVQGQEHAVREICELIIGLTGNYTPTVANRMNFSDAYQAYLKTKNIKTPLFFKEKKNNIEPISLI